MTVDRETETHGNGYGIPARCLTHRTSGYTHVPVPDHTSQRGKDPVWFFLRLEGINGPLFPDEFRQRKTVHTVGGTDVETDVTRADHSLQTLDLRLHQTQP